MLVSAWIRYQNICANSHLLFHILTITTTTHFATFASILEALAILLQTTTFHTVTPTTSQPLERSHSVHLPILASDTPAGLTTGLTGPVTLAILCLTVGFDTTATNASLRWHLFHQIIDLFVSCIKCQILRYIELIKPSECDGMPL